MNKDGEGPSYGQTERKGIVEFRLRIELGNAAMRTWGDIAGAVAKMASRFDGRAREGEGEIRDVNGNTVGTWEVAEPAPTAPRDDETAIYQAQNREDARARKEGRKPRCIESMYDITDQRYTLIPGRHINRDGLPFIYIGRVEEGPGYVKPAEVDELTRRIVRLLNAEGGK